MGGSDPIRRLDCVLVSRFRPADQEREPNPLWRVDRVCTRVGSTRTLHFSGAQKYSMRKGNEQIGGPYFSQLAL
jgi:hypothetical protein